MTETKTFFRSLILSHSNKTEIITIFMNNFNITVMSVLYYTDNKGKKITIVELLVDKHSEIYREKKTIGDTIGCQMLPFMRRQTSTTQETLVLASPPFPF